MDLLTINFDLTIDKISEWVEEWKEKRYGKESLNPERYYNLSEDGRYLFGVKEGASLNDEKAICECVTELLLRIRLINQKLNGVGLSQHLQYVERERLKKEREGLYNEFLDIVQKPQSLNPEPQQGHLDYYCQKAVEKGYLKKTDTGFVRVKERMTKAMLAYFLRNFLNPDGTFPEKKYNLMFGENRLGNAYSQLPNNKHGDGKPRGYEEIDEILLL